MNNDDLKAIREYLYDNKIIDEKNKINVDFLGEEPTEFSIVPVPVDPIVETYINGISYRQYQFQLLSCQEYGSDVMTNLSNSSFYGELYEKIEKLNKERTLPNIKGIDKIKCLDNGAIQSATPNTARYSILMQILYYKEV